MDASLTVLLPVHNLESTLSRTVSEILEVAAALTGRFEVLIVDDGSTDTTGEIAHDLGRLFPQVRAIRHPEHLGCTAAVRTGIEQSQGDWIFVCEEISRSSIEGIAKLWQANDRQEITIDDPDLPMGPDYRLLDRRSMEQLHGISRPRRPNYLDRSKSRRPS